MPGVSTVTAAGLLPRLRALEISEERRLAGRVAGLLYLTAAITVMVILVLPGAVTDHWPLVSAMAAVALVWGTACLLVIPWERVHPIVSHASSAAGFPLTALAMSATGGASSPGRFYLLFIVLYCSWFYPRPEAAAYLVGCVVVHALPLAYDDGAIEQGFLGELLVLGLVYLLLGGLILAGKRLLVDLREEAKALALQDPLTGLANRRALLQQLEHHVHAGERVGLLLLDLDGFKDANTLYGHPGGDRVLCEIAATLTDVGREADTVARLGGDEFAIVALDARTDGMRSLASRLVAEVRNAVPSDLPGLQMSASVGWAVHPDDAMTVHQLVAAADVAMRAVKAGGKDSARAATGPVGSAVAT